MFLHTFYDKQIFGKTPGKISLKTYVVQKHCMKPKWKMSFSQYIEGRMFKSRHQLEMDIGGLQTNTSLMKTAKGRIRPIDN